MVKGISRQVIVVEGPGQELFEQAIFILRENALKEGVTDEALLKEAKAALRQGRGSRKIPFWHGAFWAVAGAAVTGAAWVVTLLI